MLHLGVERPVTPARKAHPAFVVDDLDALAAALWADGHAVTDAGGEVPGVRLVHADDPFGNRLEVQKAWRSVADLADLAGPWGRGRRRRRA